jgi:4-amino-4-deoxy-L-arabinose transferase-like glycosyltransferase
MQENAPSEKYRKAFFALLIATTLFHLFYISWIDLAPDEAYYWTWSRNLQMSYYDHPPMVATLIWLGTTIFGQGEFGVRIVWVLIGALLTILLYQMGKSMFGTERAAFFSAVLLNISLMGSTVPLIATPDGPLILFWGLAIFSLYLAVEKENRGLWYLTGVWFGLGMLSKYTMIFLIPVTLFFLLSFSEGRKWLARKEPYLALLLGFLLFSPVIFWNAENGWVSFRFQLTHGLGIKGDVEVQRFWDYWGGQIGVVTPLAFLAVLWALIKSAQEGFQRQKKNLLLLFWSSAPILLFFAATSFRSKVEVNWPALAYFSAALALAGIGTEEWSTWGKWKKGYAWVTSASVLLITFLAYLQPLYPLIPIPVGNDPTRQLVGWRTLGERIQKAADTMDPLQGLFLLTPRHQLVGEGMFYTRQKYPVYQWDAPLRINHLSAKNSPAIGSQAIFFTEDEDQLPDGLPSFFATCEKEETLSIQRNSTTLRIHPIWKCKGFKGMK